MGNSIQEAVQVFCPICSRGVLVRNESMYRCPRCDRQVCRPCFDKEHRLCVECCGPLKGRPNTGPTFPAADEPVPAVDQPPPVARRDRAKQGVWFFLTGIVAFVAIMLSSLVVTVPGWLTPVVAGIGVIAFVGGIILILKN